MYSVYVYPVSRQKLPSFLGIFRPYPRVYADYACTVARIYEGIIMNMSHANNNDRYLNESFYVYTEIERGPFARRK